MGFPSYRGHITFKEGHWLNSFARPGRRVERSYDRRLYLCEHDRLREADVYFENDFCIYSSTRDPRDPPDVIPGCGVIVPKVHRASPFDLTAEEWAATRELLFRVRAELHQRLAPDGYTLGWNDQGGLHPRLHVVPRFDDEPMVDHGVRSGIKDLAIRRPDPWRPRHGEAHGRIMKPTPPERRKAVLVAAGQLFRSVPRLRLPRFDGRGC
jgi:diadenosine tetraphosphate (Ap4A) HIT family hydrolase